MNLAFCSAGCWKWSLLTGKMLTSVALSIGVCICVCVCAPSSVGNKKIKSENGSILQDMAFHIELYFTTFSGRIWLLWTIDYWFMILRTQQGMGRSLSQLQILGKCSQAARLTIKSTGNLNKILKILPYFLLRKSFTSPHWTSLGQV